MNPQQVTTNMALPHAYSIPAVHAFLQYDSPIKMAPEEPDPPREQSLQWLKYWLFRTSDMRFIPDPRLVEYVGEYKRCQRKEAPSQKTTQMLLESLFPTKYWKDNGERFKQPVSTTQATRPVLLNMYNKLDTEMENRQALKVTSNGSKVHGYCPIRYSLHMELFDELLRQITLECRFRGYLLNRVRGELYETLDAYKALLHMSLAEDSRTETAEVVDPEITSLRKRLSILEIEVEGLQTEKLFVACDYKELCDKMDLLDRIRTQLHEPEIDFTKRIQDAMGRQKFHFENPPSFEEEELEPVLNI